MAEKQVLKDGFATLGAYRVMERVRTRLLRWTALQKKGAKCEECGIDDPRVLQFVGEKGWNDVISDQQKRKKWKTRQVYQHVASGSTGDSLRVLCANCTLIYGPKRGRPGKPYSEEELPLGSSLRTAMEWWIGLQSAKSVEWFYQQARNEAKEHGIVIGEDNG